MRRFKGGRSSDNDTGVLLSKGRKLHSLFKVKNLLSDSTIMFTLKLPFVYVKLNLTLERRCRTITRIIIGSEEVCF